MKHSWSDIHVSRSVASLLKALYATLGIFVALYVIFHISSAVYTSFIINRAEEQFREGLIKDTAYLQIQGDALVKTPDFVTRLIHEQRADFLDYLTKEKDARMVGSFSVVDSDGVIIGRTLSKGKFGDNIFLTSPIGRAVAQQKSVQSIETDAAGNRLALITARPILNQNENRGALFASYILDDTYATRFQHTYLSKGTDIVFYTKLTGIVSGNVSTPAIRHTVDSYFNSGSDWIQQGVSNKTIVFENGKSYIVHNIVFPGLEKSPGGVLLFIPRQDMSIFTDCITSLITVLAFILLALRIHIRHRGEERTWRYYVLLSIAAIGVFVAALILFYTRNVGYTHLERIPYTLYNSTIRLEPDYGIYQNNIEQRFSVIVDTGDEPINVVQVQLSFDPQRISIQELNTDKSKCTYIVEKDIDVKTGIIRFVCGLLDVPFGQKTIPVVDIVAVPKEKGRFNLVFDENETQVLANDGLGTNVLRMSKSGSYSVDEFSTLLDSTGTTTGRSFVVFSSTHPNSTRWYNTQNAQFVWWGKNDGVYRYVFDAYPTTIPADGHIVQGTNTTVSVPGDGTYYFHLQLASGGPVAHYPIHADMTQPVILSMNLSSQNIVEGDVVRLAFNAEDAASGIQKNYYVDLGDHLFLPVGKDLFVPFLEPGDQPIKLRVYDEAGNFTERTQVVHVNKK